MPSPLARLLELPLVCPACRTRDESAWSMFTIEPESESHLACVGCARRYPIIDGVPILVPDLASLMQSDGLAITESVSPEVAATLAAPIPDGEPWPRLIEFISTWMTAHYGDWVSREFGPALPFGFEALAGRVSESRPVERAVDLGCGFGRGTLALAGTADEVVGLDLAAAAVRRAAKLAAGEPVSYGVREAGRHYTTRTVVPPGRTSNVSFMVGDALDPPLPPASFDRVMALNLIDSIRSPATLLNVMDGLCAPGGELILASPFAWSSEIMEESERIGTTDPAAAVMGRLTRGEGLSSRYVIEESTDLPWTLRRDSRSYVGYTVAWIRARRMG